MARSKRTIKRRSTIAQRERRVRHAEATERIAAMFGQYANHIHRQAAWGAAFADQMVNGG